MTARPMRWRWQQLGGHIHVGVYTQNPRGGAWEKCGDLVFNEEEWPGVEDAVRRHVLGAELVPVDLREHVL